MANMNGTGSGAKPPRYPTTWLYSPPGEQIWVIWDDESREGSSHWCRIDFFYDLGDLAAGEVAQSVRVHEGDVALLIMFLEEYQERRAPKQSEVGSRSRRPM